MLQLEAEKCAQRKASNPIAPQVLNRAHQKSVSETGYAHETFQEGGDSAPDEVLEQDGGDSKNIIVSFHKLPVQNIFD